ncbi:YbaK/EbsC family protein [Pseudoxanthomonas winnipegensis]|uniref:YbaK/EbsC family protein n=1 Tax=Pseudoxanthomonas winnipegensis TaxID=2480810 RepID=A0A4Q8LD66_9GAMM|nr:YbaK/EbsC family protein [Pseudoxanthomonas winnipegensis]TAA26813.1 YbaK/EbsC family protein [Pseudoxanthomonas winnipegensis]
MSIASVRAFFQQHAPEVKVIEHAQSTATVAMAAEALGVTPGQIAKTLALGLDDALLLLVMAGDARLDNQKFKAAFGTKPRLLPPEQTLALTGHPVGGVCPFGLAGPARICCDVSLRAHALVYPAAGSPNSAVCLAPSRLADLVQAQWVDVGKA